MKQCNDLKVQSREILTLVLIGRVEFWLYIHGEGEEYFFHYDYWPYVPDIHHVRTPEVNLDIVVKKTTEISEEDCNDEEDYSYFGMQMFRMFE